MRISNKITVRWLRELQKTRAVRNYCIEGFKRDFGNGGTTRDVVRGLNERKYTFDDLQGFLCFLIILLFPRGSGPKKIEDCDTCDTCMTPKEMRAVIYRQLKKQGD